MTGLDPDYRHRTTLKFSRALMIIMVIGSIGRVFVTHLPDFIIWLGFINVALAATAYWVIRSKRLPRYEPLIAVGLCFIYVYPLFFTTGGVNSQYVYFMTLIPIVTALVGSVRMTWTVCIIQMLLVLMLFMLGDRIPDLTGYPFIEEKTRVRSVWLIVGIIVASYFGVYFRKAYDEQSALLDKLASIDPLTGLLNRRGLKVRLDEELRRSARSRQPLSVLMMDVDYFKQFNDQHGHAAGDDCLVKLAHCLRKNTRAEDIVSRYGGEEFLIVLTNADISSAKTAAEKLRKAIANIDSLEEGVHVSVTIGAASIVPASDCDQLPAAEDLIRNADSALYRGKEAGRNRVEYFSDPKADPAYA
jgi:diguanylate cyclase (GGDEF)-like protein